MNTDSSNTNSTDDDNTMDKSNEFSEPSVAAYPPPSQHTVPLRRNKKNNNWRDPRMRLVTLRTIATMDLWKEVKHGKKTEHAKRALEGWLLNMKIEKVLHSEVTRWSTIDVQAVKWVKQYTEYEAKDAAKTGNVGNSKGGDSDHPVFHELNGDFNSRDERSEYLSLLRDLSKCLSAKEAIAERVAEEKDQARKRKSATLSVAKSKKRCKQNSKTPMLNATASKNIGTARVPVSENTVSKGSEEVAMDDATSHEQFAASTKGKTYQPVPFHFKIPHGIFLYEATSVAVDRADNVYVFNRGNIPVLVFDRSGNLIRKWGNDTPFNGTDADMDAYGNGRHRWRGTEFVRPHSIRIDHEDNVWLVDDMANTITKCTQNGKRLMMLLPGGRVLNTQREMKEAVGKVFRPAEKQSGNMFNRPTDVAIHPTTGDIFVTDGYGNSRVHRLDRKGKHVCSFGRSGTDPGEFNVPHNIAIHPDLDKILVVDRENSRVQVFSLEGKYLNAIHAHRAVSVAVAPVADMLGMRAKSKDYIFIAEQGSTSSVQRGDGMQHLDTWTKRIGHRIAWYTADTTEKHGHIGADTPGERPDQFNWLHSVAIDSEGSVYAAEVSFCECGRHQKPYAREMVSLRKWELVGTSTVTV